MKARTKIYKGNRGLQDVLKITVFADYSSAHLWKAANTSLQREHHCCISLFYPLEIFKFPPCPLPGSPLRAQLMVSLHRPRSLAGSTKRRAHA